MRHRRPAWPSTSLAMLFALGLAGFVPPPATARLSGDDEAAVRQAFADVLTAVKAKDADKLWDLLSTKSRADSERIAKALAEAYAKAGAGDKAKQEKDLGLSAAAVGGLTGKGYLNTQVFWRRYHDLPGSKVERVTVSGDTATVHFLETDGDKEKMNFLRQGGVWKVWMSIPRPGGPAAAVADDGKPAKSVALADVGKHVDEKCVVLMAVKSTGRSRDLVFLNSAANFRDEGNFTVVLHKDAVDKLKQAKVDDPASYFKGRSVRVTGTITLFRDKPQIVVDDPARVEIVESK